MKLVGHTHPVVGELEHESIVHPVFFDTSTQGNRAAARSGSDAVLNGVFGERLDEEGRIGAPLGTESGYWRPRPDDQIEVMLAHPTGIVEIYLGEITGTRIEMATDVVARTATAKEVTAGHRLYGLVGPDGPAEQDLAYAYDMAAVGQELQPHLSAQLKRVSRE